MVESKDTPRKKLWESIEGIQVNWEKSFNVFSDSNIKKREMGVVKEDNE